MAQHDYVIANGTGAAVRSDLNNALAAIVSNNSGATEPATMYAYQWWADTTTGLLKLRNAANNAWITLFQLDGEWSTLAVENGSAAAPSIYFKDSGTDTGFYSPAANEVAVATNGTGRLFVNSSGSVGIGTSSPGARLSVETGSSDTIPFITSLGTVNGSEDQIFLRGGGTSNYYDFRRDTSTGRLEIQGSQTGFNDICLAPTSGRVGIGTTAPSALLSLKQAAPGNLINTDDGTVVTYIADTTGSVLTYGTFTSHPVVFKTANGERARFDTSGRLLVGTSSALTGSTSQVARNVTLGNTSSATGDAVLAIGRGSAGTGLAAGNGIGTIVFTDNAAAEFASIACLTDTTTSAGDYPGRLVFSTTADGASSPTERLRIGNAGGIDVSATGNADNYLRNTAGQTTASGANLFIDSSSGVLRRSTSSIKYKTDIETLQDSYANEILKCRPVWYRSTSDYDNQQWGYWGFIAEEVAEVDPRLCFYGKNEDGSLEPEGVQYDRFVPHLLNLIKRQQQAIEDLQAKVAALEAA